MRARYHPDYTPSVAKALAKAYFPALMAGVLFKFVYDLLVFVGPNLLDAIISYLSVRARVAHDARQASFASFASFHDSTYPSRLISWCAPGARVGVTSLLILTRLCRVRCESHVRASVLNSRMFGMVCALSKALATLTLQCCSVAP